LETGLQGDDDAVAQGHAPAAQRIGLDGVDRHAAIIEPPRHLDQGYDQPARHRGDEGAEGGDLVGGGQADVQGNAEQQRMQQLGDLGHERDEHARRPAHGDGQEHQGELAGAQ
jgi:hypothetical protein